MKIPKLFKKAAALVMAAVTALSVLPATTAFAAGDIGTISFTHTYDSSGNAMRYNSSANIGGYTAGGTGNYKYRMYVDGEDAFCIQPGVPLKTGNTLAKASSETWNALSANQKKAVGLALLYGYQGNRSNLTGSDDEKWLATQTLVWEFVTGCREATGSYKQTSTTVYSLHLCQKSMFVVPNHLVGQWASEYLRLYPSANILVTTKQDFEISNRKKFCGRIATGDYDAVIIGHSQFEKIQMSVERQREQLQKQLDDIEMGIDEVQKSHGEQFTVKQLMKTRKGIEANPKKHFVSFLKGIAAFLIIAVIDGAILTAF